MSDPGSNPSASADLHSAQFLEMIAQYSNMALMFVGQVPHPETGERVRELEAARVFIERLEMLEAKTRGNLTKREETLLKQSLMTTRLAFVQAVEQEEKPATPTPTPSPTRTPTPTPPVPSTESADPAAATPAASPSSTGAPAAEPEGAAPPTTDDRKKFVKKY